MQAKFSSGVAKYDYYVNGSRKSLTLPNEVYTEYAYDNLLRLDKIEHWQDDTQSDLLAEFDYDVGRTGKRLGVSETIDDSTADWQYNYDGLDRIADATRSIQSATTATVYAYTYDLVGNRLSKSVGASSTTYTYNALDQLTQESTGGVATTYSYDSKGNLSKKEWNSKEVNYVYDSRNRLKQYFDGAVAPGNLAVEYAYDYSGNRYWKVEKTGDSYAQTRFLIDSNNLTGYSQSLLEIDWDDGSIDKRYEYGDDLYCQVDVSPLALQPSFFLYDGLGSTRSLTNSDGEMTQTYNYHPFGDGIGHPGELATNHLFTGEYFDQNLSYYYLRARYYAPAMARFTGFDPVEDAANKLHKYAYCGNDPLLFCDPLGTWTIIELKVTAIIVSIVAGIALGSFKALYDTRNVTHHDPVWSLSVAYGAISGIATALAVFCPQYSTAALDAVISTYLSDNTYVWQIVAVFCLNLAIGILASYFGGKIGGINRSLLPEGGGIKNLLARFGLNAGFGFINAVATFMTLWCETHFGVRPQPTRMEVCGSVGVAFLLGVTTQADSVHIPPQNRWSQAAIDAVFVGGARSGGSILNEFIKAVESFVAGATGWTPIPWEWSESDVKQYDPHNWFE